MTVRVNAKGRVLPAACYANITAVFAVMNCGVAKDRPFEGLRGVITYANAYLHGAVGKKGERHSNGYFSFLQSH